MSIVPFAFDCWLSAYADNGHYRIPFSFLLIFHDLLFEPPIPYHEGLQHVRDQRCRIDRFTVGLRVQRGVAVDAGSNAQQRGQHRTGENAIPMPIDAILQTGVAGRVSAGQVVERDRHGDGAGL